MTDALAAEIEEHRKWKLRPQHENARAFEALVQNEFRPPEQHQAHLAVGVRNIVRFAAEHVPYYAKLFEKLGLGRQDLDTPEDLAKLPALTKHDILEYGQELRSRALPVGEHLSGETQSSGTTGRRVTVLHSSGSFGMFHLLRHRNARVHRLDPMSSRVDVRQRSDVFANLGPGQEEPRVVSYGQWRSLGTYFHTGPEFGFPVSRPMEEQVALLKELRPDYAMTFPGVFEEWLLANEWTKPVDSIKTLIGIGSQLTPSMRTRLEESYGAPVHMNYGLNEIGMVAVRCPSGRYHVHTEHCLVQIADAAGQPCKPGEVGHVLITGFRNYAMPLIRYDTGDLAEVASGPCPCGRTLPSFGEIAGRYRRYAGLPEGTRERVRAIRETIENCAAAEIAFLRRYQIHQNKQNNFTLRLRTVAAVPDAFRAKIAAAWTPFPASILTLQVLDDIATSPSGKILDFTSDFHGDSAYPANFDNAVRPLADT
jgi:phenylacetate-CoA ligase